MGETDARGVRTECVPKGCECLLAGALWWVGRTAQKKSITQMLRDMMDWCSLFKEMGASCSSEHRFMLADLPPFR